MAQRPDQTDFDNYQNLGFGIGNKIALIHQLHMFVDIEHSFFENDTNGKEIDANAVAATFRVKFDHVAMDNFHAVFTRGSEPGRSIGERRLSQNSLASSGGGRPTIVSKATIVRVRWLRRDPTAMRTLLTGRTAEQRRSATDVVPGRARARDEPCGAVIMGLGGGPGGSTTAGYRARSASCCVSSCQAPELV